MKVNCSCGVRKHGFEAAVEVARHVGELKLELEIGQRP